MRKIIFLALLVFALNISSGLAFAWEESFEGHWEEIPSSGYKLTNAYIDSDSGFTCMQSNQHTATIQINESYTGYLRYNTVPSVSTLDNVFQMYAADGTAVYDSGTMTFAVVSGSYNVIELIEAGDQSSLTVYCNGVAKGSASRLSEKEVATIKISQYCGYEHTHFDDFSTSPFSVGTKGFYQTSSSTVYNTVTVPLANTYHLTLSKNSGEILNTWNITSNCQTISYPVSTYFDEDGFYYLDIYDTAGTLYYSKLLYFSSLGVFPTSYFTIQSDTAADIRDHSLNGGLITGGGTVYLTPSDTENYYQDFTIEFQEPAYKRELTLSKIFNTSRIDGSIIYLSGLNSNVYNVSIDNVYIGSTNADNSWAHTVDWIGDNSYILELSPDFSSPGVWGYVKDSYTRENIPYAQLYTINSSYSSNIYADENGMYYLGGLYPGPYSVQASKKGYISSSAQPFTASQGETTRKDIYLDSSGAVSGSGLYYAPHDVAFTILEYWYSGAGLTGVNYAIYNGTTEVKTGSTDSKGMFTGADMKGGTNYTITLTHNGTTYTEYVEPSLSEYIFILNKEGILHEYYNSWLNLSYTENNGSIAIAYVSNKTVSAAAVTVTAANGTDIISDSKNDSSGSFNFNLSSGDYTIKFNIEAEDGSTASQFWTLSSPPEVNLFPASYPTWLKNLLYVGIIMIFLLAFGKSKNDVACGSAAVLVSLGYYFKWLSCGFNFVVLVWIIALGAIYLHYKRTGALG